MIYRMLALHLLILMRSFVMADDSPQTLFDFTGADSAKECDVRVYPSDPPYLDGIDSMLRK